MTKPILPLALLTAAILLAACAQTPPPGAGTPSPTPSPAGSTQDAAPATLTGSRWLLAELNGEPAVSGTTVTARFGDDGTVAGSGGCNRFTGRYTLSGQTLRIEPPLASTMMACPEPVMAQETSFFTALEAVRGYSVEAQRLTLTAEGGAVLTTFDAQVQELTGTTWAVAGYNDGRGVVSPIQGTNPTLTFADDGRVSGSGGCNTLTGSYTVGDGTVTIGPLASTRKACPEPEGVMEQENHLAAALETAATFSVEGDVLELRTADADLAVRLTRG